MSNNIFTPICMAEEFWANTHFSIARHYGSISVGNHVYVIVNKEGKDIYECSREADIAGRRAGQPCDLCRRDFVKYYRKLGRDRFLQVLKDNQQKSDKQIIRIFNEMKS